MGNNHFNPKTLELVRSVSELDPEQKRDFYQAVQNIQRLELENPPAQNKNDPWKKYKIRDAYEPRPPVEYMAGVLFAIPSLNIVYGAPGTLKSFLLADLLVSAAAGREWLEPAPWQPGAKSISTKQAPVIWVDFDNGKRRTHDRFAALGRAKGLPIDDELLTYYTMPTPWLNGSNKASVGGLSLRAQELGARLIVIDNLGLVSGDADENSTEMTGVMSEFRQLAEEADAAVILIHHQRKSNGTTGRAGDTLRGHSSIEAALDLALLIEREERADIIRITPTKDRGVDTLPFAATFTYENDPETGELAKACFFGIIEEDNQSGQAIEREIRAALYGTAMNKGDLVKAVKQILPDVGTNRVRERIDRMAGNGQLHVSAGTRTEKRYSLP